MRGGCSKGCYVIPTLWDMLPSQTHRLLYAIVGQEVARPDTTEVSWGSETRNYQLPVLTIGFVAEYLLAGGDTVADLPNS